MPKILVMLDDMESILKRAEENPVLVTRIYFNIVDTGLEILRLWYG